MVNPAVSWNLNVLYNILCILFCQLVSKKPRDDDDTATQLDIPDEQKGTTTESPKDKSSPQKGKDALKKKKGVQWLAT